MPCAEARMGTLRVPETCAKGRTFRTARSGGRVARGCLPDGWVCEGDGGGGRGVGGTLVRPRGRVAMSCERVFVLAVLPAVAASSWSTV